MADYLVTDSELTSVANAIRTKGGTSASLSFPTGFVSAIDEIPTGSGDTYTWFGANPVLLGENEFTITLDDTTYPSWTPSTSSTTILAAGAYDWLPFIAEPDYDLYDMAFVLGLDIRLEYASGTEMKAAQKAWFYKRLHLRGKYFNSASAYSSGVPNSLTYEGATVYRLQYYNTSGAIAPGSSNYGVYTSSTPGSGTKTVSGVSYSKITTPAVFARCSTSYFSTTAAAAVDTAASTIKFSAKAYRVDKPNPWFQLQKMVSDDWRALT